MVWIYALTSVIIISLLSFVGIVTFAVKQKYVEKVLLVLVAFSVGALLGDSFFHLLPEAVEKSGGFTIQIALLLLTGIIIFFSLEKFLHWRHCHQEHCADHAKELGMMNLIGDAAHNFIDGVFL
jgi:zinc and cadmium transporter